jgi:hypothetical protein
MTCIDATVCHPVADFCAISVEIVNCLKILRLTEVPI